MRPEAQGVSLARLRQLAPIVRRLAEAASLDDVRVFGSVARGEQTTVSDVDLLVRPREDATLFSIAQFEIEMETLLGAPVTAVPVTSLDARSDVHILREAETIC